MEKPTVGRIVHYFDRDINDPNGKILPFAAIITHVIPGIDNSVLLTLFLPGAVRCVTKPVPQGTIRGCWNYPKREPSIIATA